MAGSDDDKHRRLHRQNKGLFAFLNLDEGDDALTDADADEAPPRPDPETSRKSRRGQERKMDDSDQPPTVRDEVRLDIDATPPSEDATQLGQQVLDEGKYRPRQNPKRGLFKEEGDKALI
ncbi:uncharacterized protein LOC127804428 [Diospyros lotus]|uniref:uncharacterized protein LOC127804428 n=1 Tax=Diospyros lotus TaxID=55363 RepID=UPI00224DAB49|nr:uncharacterized protein LOC127804428 [Diospyros lotus]